MVLNLQLPQLKQRTHEELCAHVQKLQLSCTNLQHKLTNVSSRATHTEEELKIALQHIRRLKRDLSELRKVFAQRIRDVVMHARTYARTRTRNDTHIHTCRWATTSKASMKSLVGNMQELVLPAAHP